MTVMLHFILLALMDISELLITFVHVVLTWKHGMSAFMYYKYLCIYCIVACSEGRDETPLACAASKGHVKIMNHLLGQNVDVNGGTNVMY